MNTNRAFRLDVRALPGWWIRSARSHLFASAPVHYRPSARTCDFGQLAERIWNNKAARTDQISLVACLRQRAHGIGAEGLTAGIRYT